MSPLTRHELRRAEALYRANAADQRDHAMRLECDTDPLPDMTRDYGPQPYADGFAVVCCLISAFFFGFIAALVFLP